jgi:hypothetical protein
MKTEIGRTFESIFDRGEAHLIEDYRLESCQFINCGLSLTKDIQRRTIVRNVEAVNCSLNGCFVGPAIFDRVNVDGLSTNDLLIFWGSLFKNVKFSGQIGKLKINPFADAIDRSIDTQRPFDEFREQFYKSIDWAIDIRDARFKEFDARGIPARLFILDPETQAIVTRERALRPGWRERVSPANKLWPFMIKLFLSDGDADTVFVVPLGAPKEKRDALIRGLRELRDLGVALPV